jgi:hypothetical protein
MQNPREMTTEIFRLTRELMSPLAKVHGPLFGGTFRSGNLSGPFFLTETRQWLWFPKQVSRTRAAEVCLTDAQLSVATDVYTVLGQLLASTRESFDVLLKHLAGIKNSPRFLTDVGLYLISPATRAYEIVQADSLGKFEPATSASPTIDEVLRDFAASHWIKGALRTAMDRDPVDAANDAEVLAQLLTERCFQQ